MLVGVRQTSSMSCTITGTHTALCSVTVQLRQANRQPPVASTSCEDAAAAEMCRHKRKGGKKSHKT